MVQGRYRRRARDWMCGILAALCETAEQYQAIKTGVLEKLTHRGPDASREVTVPCAARDKQLFMLGTLLHMRGDLTPQPLASGREGGSGSNYLLWNGNVFGGMQVCGGGNDTVKVLAELEEGAREDPQAVLSVLSRVHGPWAFVYWQSSSNSLWFGRDFFGRRSLLWHLPTSSEDSFFLSSVGCYGGKDEVPVSYWSEVPASCVFKLQLGAHQKGLLQCCPWIQNGETFQEKSNLQQLKELRTHLEVVVTEDCQLSMPFGRLNVEIPMAPHAAEMETFGSSPSSDPFLLRNRDSKENSEDSGGTSKESSESSTVTCLEDTVGSNLAQKFLDVLQAAVKVRVCNAPLVSVLPRPEACALGESDVVMGMARVAVLFSGGVDSAVIAALVDRCLPPSEEVDLINVAFEMRLSSSPTESESSFQVPDRLSAVECLKEFNPHRKWNLIQVNVSLEELNRMRSEAISQSIYPLGTVLDDSIGCALWFGARGRGILHDESAKHIAYKSRAKTLLIGIGADELLAGYSRHRTKFKCGGWLGLLEEMDKDIKRLARRNLGRDDRCVGDHHRDGQFPFLDENVVSFLQELPITSKVDFSLPRGVGEKYLLRKVASMLGCRLAADMPKRAIQFGSRIAKLSETSGGREDGASTSKRLARETDSKCCVK